MLGTHYVLWLRPAITEFGERDVDTMHFGYSGHLQPPLSGHYIRLAIISDLNIIE